VHAIRKRDLACGVAEPDSSIRDGGDDGDDLSLTSPFAKMEEASSDFFLLPAKARFSFMPPATAALKPLVAGDGFADGIGGTGLL